MREYREVCVLTFTTMTCLDHRAHDHELTISGFGSPFHLDGNKTETGKGGGWGVVSKR